MDNTRSDKGEVIAFALSELSCKKEKTVMVGDRKHDIIGAGKNRIDSIGVLYGYGCRAEMTAAKPNYLADEVGDLLSLLIK